MNRSWQRALLLAIASTLALAAGSASAQETAGCVGEHDSYESACLIGTPDSRGITVRDALQAPGQARAYRFEVGPEPGAGLIYLGDLWYDLEVALWRDAPGSAEPGRAALVAESRTFEARTLQFVRPQMIVQSLEPGSYTVVVRARDGGRVDPGRRFTVRVALGPPVCDLQRDAADRYQLGLALQPSQPTPFSLLSFNAYLSPPYSDLFDFDWRINGQPVLGDARETAQIAMRDLGAAPGQEYRVQLTARGVRAYPDPDPRYRHVPPTLSVECTFRLP